MADRHPTSVDDLINIIKEVWMSEIKPEYCGKLVKSMPNRIQAVLKNKGYSIKY